MQLSVSSGKYGIIQRATFLAFGNSTDHTADYPLADMVASANRWVMKVGQWLWQASSTWVWDDKNQTTATIPVSNFTLTDNLATYTIPATVFGVKAASIKDINGIWLPLTQITYGEIARLGQAPDEYKKTKGLPDEYLLDGYNVQLFCPPDTSKVTASNGFKLFVSREATTFTIPASYTTADTTEPGFPEQYHDIVCLGIAYDWCLTNGPDSRASSLRAEIAAAQQDIFKTEHVKNQDLPTRITPRTSPGMFF